MSAVRARLAASLPGVRRQTRPADAGVPSFELTRVRSGPRGRTPVLVIPGGPGLGSVLPYVGLRRRAADLGLDLLMVEHRGVGLSRTDLRGRDLPARHLRVAQAVDDLAAALDAEGIDRVVVSGSSYGSYLAAGFGVRHPERVAAMVLDSPMLGAADQLTERSLVRARLWNSDDRELRQGLRRLVDAGLDQTGVLVTARAAFESGGTGFARALVTARARGHGRLTWAGLHASARRGRRRSLVRPLIYEFDLLAPLAFAELGYAPPPDGLPFDSALVYADAARALGRPLGPHRTVREPFDLPAALPGFDWPTVVLSGRNDLRTPPALAERAVELLPDPVSALRLRHGHSALEADPEVPLEVWRTIVTDGPHAVRADRLAALPRRGWAGRLPRWGNALMGLENRLAPGGH